MAKQAKILLDSGASGSIVSERFVKRFKQKKDETCTWKTMAGSFTTSKQCIVEFTLPELNPTAKVRHKMYVVPKMDKYDLIIGRDILQKLGMNLLEKVSHFKQKMRVSNAFSTQVTRKPTLSR